MYRVFRVLNMAKKRQKKNWQRKFRTSRRTFKIKFLSNFLVSSNAFVRSNYTKKRNIVNFVQWDGRLWIHGPCLRVCLSHVPSVCLSFLSHISNRPTGCISALVSCHLNENTTFLIEQAMYFFYLFVFLRLKRTNKYSVSINFCLDSSAREVYLFFGLWSREKSRVWLRRGRENMAQT